MTDVGLDNLKTVAEAIAVIDGLPVTPRIERVALADADGRVLAVAVMADRDTPPFDKALMDGYAVRSADVATAGVTLAVVGEIAAGAIAGRSVAAGTCVAIMTGAPLPPGADAVVPVEWTQRTGDAVTIDRPVPARHAVSSRGSEAAAGRPLLPAGLRLGPASLAVCAQVGVAVPEVFARPRVGILSTGDEIIPYADTPSGAQIRGSNSILLTALVRRLGGEPVDLGHAADDPAAIAAKLQAPGVDVLLVTGGMSMGVHDYTPRVLRDLGYDLAVTKLKIKPGKPFVFAKSGLGAWGLGIGEDANRADGASSHSPQAVPFVFGLPGNPVSVFVCTVRLASRLMLRIGGVSPEPLWIDAPLADGLPINGPREFYQPAEIIAGVARVLPWTGSADLFTLARANALLIRAADEAALPAGAVVTLLRLP